MHLLKITVVILGVGAILWGSPFRKLLVEPESLGSLTTGSCERVTLKLVNAEGKGARLEREKLVELSSSSSGTTFFSDFEPPCAEGVKTTSVTFEPGKSVVSFYFREDLLQITEPTKRGIPHDFSITASLKGSAPITISGEVRSNDCSVACRDTCINNRVGCTKACPAAKDAKASKAEKRKCWSDCFLTEEGCFQNCQKADLKYPSGQCGSVCETYCEYFYGDCFGKCYFHKDASNTSFGAKCAEECVNQRESCREKGCAALTSQ